MAIFFVVFAIFNAQYNLINLPFFWDELGVYSRASIYLASHKLSILPNALPDELSRGHPILIPFLFGSVLKIFGIKIVVFRFFALFLFTIGLFFIYKICIQYVSKLESAAILLLCAIQPVFLSQSILCFPEMPLMVCTLAASYFFIVKKYVQLLVALCIAVLIKESALVIPIAFGISYYILHPQRKNIYKAFAITLLPIAIFLLFLIVQKIQNGYYIFPLHENLMDFDFVVIKNKLLLQLDFIFIDQGRFILTLLVALSLIKGIYYKNISFGNPTLYISVLFIALGGLAFTAINYFLARYMQFFLMPILLYLLYFIVINNGRWLKLVSFAAIALFAILFTNNKKRFVDTDFAYINHVKTNEMAFNFLVENTLQTDTVAYNWPMVMNFWESNTGYQKPNSVAKELTQNNGLYSDYLVISHPGNNINIQNIKSNYIKIAQFTKGYAYVAIYKKKAANN